MIQQTITEILPILQVFGILLCMTICIGLPYFMIGLLTDSQTQSIKAINKRILTIVWDEIAGVWEGLIWIAMITILPFGILALIVTIITMIFRIVF